MQNKKTFENNFSSPLRDKTKLMKTEHLLSNNYALAVIVILLDSFAFLLLNYTKNLLFSLPKLLFKQTSAEAMLSLSNALKPCASGRELWVLLLIVAVLDAVLVYKIKVSWSEDHFNVGQKGTARFITEEEIKQEYKAVPMLETPYPGNPGILVSRMGDTFYIDDNVTNNLIIGQTRSGKGEAVVKSSIELYSRAEHKPSMLINDMKLELYKTFAVKLCERGYDVYLLNASNPKLSMGYNPLTVILSYYKKKDYDMAEMVANSLANDYFDASKAMGDMVFFTNAAAALCTAMILASVEDAIQADEEENAVRFEAWKEMGEGEKKAHPFRYRTDNEKCVNFYSMLVNFGELVTKPINKDGSRTLVDKYFEIRPATNRARMMYLGVEIAPGKTKSSVFSEMLRQLKNFSLYNVARMTAESSLDFADIGFGDRPVAVFMAVPSYDDSLYKIPTMFIRQMYYVLGKLCDEGKGRCDRQVKVIMDETGNMPKIELMKAMTTMGLGQNISFDFYLQNYEQIEEVYGPEIAKTIKGNCGNHYYLQTNSEETAKEFSGKLGKKSIIDVHRAGGKLSIGKYFTESVQERPLLNENELMELMEGECVIHRTSKRRDKDGGKIKPRPIFNSVENGRYLLYAYEYFPEEEYPNPNEVDFLDMCGESRTHIEPKERIWDISQSFKMWERNQWRGRRLKDAGYEGLKPLLEKALGVHYEEKHGINREMTLAEFAAYISRQDIPEAERDVLLESI